MLFTHVGVWWAIEWEAWDKKEKSSFFVLAKYAEPVGSVPRVARLLALKGFYMHSFQAGLDT